MAKNAGIRLRPPDRSYHLSEWIVFDHRRHRSFSIGLDKSLKPLVLLWLAIGPWKHRSFAYNSRNEIIGMVVECRKCDWFMWSEEMDMLANLRSAIGRILG